jgi:hypothetical protein
VGDEPISAAGPLRRRSTSESASVERSVHRTSYDPSADGSLDSAVVVAIAEATSTSPHDIEPLYETLDPDALANLFTSTIRGDPRRSGTVSFVHDGCHVTVTGDEILVEPDQSVR